jgi:argininosuccinate lyase
VVEFKMSNKKKSNKMWGGRFSEKSADLLTQLNSSIDIDKRLALEDILGSKAHVEMLAKTKIITKKTETKILFGLKKIEKELIKGDFTFDNLLEDIHMNIEARLGEIIGAEAGRIHTARSRNDQVVTDFRLWIRKAIEDIEVQLSTLQLSILKKAEKNIDIIFPGYTHLQVAQPVRFSHHLLAYLEMFARDTERFKQSKERLNECPLGAAALAGTSFPIDRFYTAKTLGFRAPMRNSMDAVSDRDFVLEFMSDSAIAMVHFSRLAEEFILWGSTEFDFISLPDSLVTGSSIMPQKKNPDAAELIRAKTGRVNGALLSLLTVMKGLPLAYAKDMQEDKEPVFDVYDTLILVIKITQELIDNMKVKKTNMYEAASNGFSTATDMADWFVRQLGMPFREAHSLTSKFVEIASEKNIKLSELSLSDLTRVEPKINESVFKVLSPHNSIESRNSFGGTASREIKRQIRFWKRRLNA